MKVQFTFYCLLFFRIRPAVSGSGPARTWTHSEGKSIQARKLLETADTVTLMLTNGRTYILETSSLSEEDRPVLMLFTGSDWCGYYIKLEKHIVSKPTFKKVAEEELVLLKVDFPRRKKLPEKQMKDNRELRGEYGIRGYPALILANAGGKKLKQFGYGSQSPGDFVAMIKGNLS